MLGRTVNDAGRTRRQRWLGLTAAALLLSLAGLIAVTLQFMRETQRTLQHVDEQADLSIRLRQTQAVLVALIDAETGQRGYLLTNNDRYLAPYRSAVARMPALMKGFDDAGQGDPAFDRKADEARQVITDKLAELAETVRLQATGHHEQAMALMLSDKGQDFMERARAELGDVQEMVRVRRDRIGSDIAAGVLHVQHLLLLAVTALLVFVALAAGQTLRTLGARTRFERALTLSEQRHRALVDDQSELVSLAHENGSIVYVNPAFARHFGREPADLAGTDRYALFDETEREAMRMEVAGVLRSGRERRSENRMVSADGQERWVAWTNKRRQEADGTLLHSVGRDITDRKRAERALRASQAFLHRTGRIAGVGGWEKDLVSNADLWSEEARRILDADESYAPDRAAIVASYAPEARATMDKAISDCIERGVAWDLELPRITETGRRIWVRTMASLDFENGKPRRIVGALQDITERKLLEQRLADSEHLLRQITDSLSVRIAYLDIHGRYRFVNWAHCKRFGKERDEIIGRTRSEMSGRRNDGIVEPRIAAVLRGEPQNFEYDDLVGGETRRIETSLLPDIGDNGLVRGFYATGIDITERVADERRLRDLTATLHSVLESLPAMVAVVDRDGRYRLVNTAFERAARLPRDQILGRAIHDIVAPAEYARRQPWIARAFAGEAVTFETYDPARRIKHLSLTYTPLRIDGRVDGFVGMALDVTQQKEEAGRLLLLTQRDALTGLLNRAGLEAWLEHHGAADELPSIALLYVDLDHFKPVNDTFGHPAGDEVLRQFALRLQELLRPGDAVARLGGDEFAVALAGVRERAHAVAVAEKIVAAAARIFEVGALDVTIGASVGIAWRIASGGDWRVLLDHADGRLYEAKASGRGTFA